MDAIILAIINDGLCFLLVVLLFIIYNIIIMYY